MTTTTHSATYHKYCPNVWLAKTETQHKRGDIIEVTNKYGKRSEHRVYNLIGSKGGFYYYSIERLGKNYAERRAERLKNWADANNRKSHEYHEKSNKHSDFLSLGEPIKVGHHSEKRHRRIIEEAQNNSWKAVEHWDKAEEQRRTAEYWEEKAQEINLSMPESLEYYAHRLEDAKRIHHEYKAGIRAREHAYSLTYANKAVKELTKQLERAEKLWG